MTTPRPAAPPEVRTATPEAVACPGGADCICATIPTTHIDPEVPGAALAAALYDLDRLRMALEIIAAKPETAPDAIGVTARNIARAALEPAMTPSTPRPAAPPLPRTLRWHAASTSRLDVPVHAFGAGYPFRALCGVGPALGGDYPAQRHCRRCSQLSEGS